jgi:hypothetical protein
MRFGVAQPLRLFDRNGSEMMAELPNPGARKVVTPSRNLACQTAKVRGHETCRAWFSHSFQVCVEAFENEKLFGCGAFLPLAFWLWGSLAVGLLGCGAFWLWGSLVCGFLAVRLFGCEAFWCEAFWLCVSRAFRREPASQGGAASCSGEEPRLTGCV